MKLKQVAIAVIVAFILFSCQSGPNAELESTALGTKVSFIRKGEGPKLESNKVMLMNFKYSTESGAVLTESEKGDLLPLLYTRDTSSANGQFQSVLNILSVGDSVTFEIPATDLFQKTFRQPVPDSIDAESNLKFELGVVEQMTREEYADYNNSKVERYNEERLAAEKALIADYLAERDVEAVITDSGLHYNITEAGTGENAKVGQTVNVKYRGTLLDGKQFDAGEYKFVLGQGSVIPGWDEGISYLNLGAKAVLYIPSKLAYGRRGARTIPPDSPLIFEVELLEVN